MQLAPNSPIPVSYTTGIPDDTTLYYVRAVLRDTQSDQILQTLNLTNVSSIPNRYQGVFNGISDPSGLGRAVDITVSVYTDSGYTILSTSYQVFQLNYVILQPWIMNLGTGGGMNIDYDKLQKMFDGAKVNNAEIGNEKSPKRVKINYERVNEGVLGATEGARAALSGELKNHIGTISKLIEGIYQASQESKKAHEDRFSVLEARINDLSTNMGKGQQMSSKERMAMKNDLISAVKEFRDEYKKSNDEGSKKSEERLNKFAEEMQEYLGENLSEKEIKMVYNVTPQKKEKEKSNGMSPEHLMALLN